MLGKVWRFLWKDDSLISWIVNIILAFLIVKFLIYPGLGLMLGTSYPVVAVVSNSMKHEGNFDEWYEDHGSWYNVNKEEMKTWIFKDGFNRGDIIFLKGVDDVKVGDVLVFNGNSNNPIIHRAVEVNENYYATKGDNNADSFSALGEDYIEKNQVIGEAFGRIPLLGYVKIIFSEVVGG